MKCTFDPKTYAGYPIGMFHCPECGEMVVAGIDHPDLEIPDEIIPEDYCKDCDPIKFPKCNLCLGC